MQSALKHKFSVLLIGFAITAIPAWAINYSYSNFQVPGSRFTSVIGINNKGAIVGNYEDSNGQVHGFVYQNGKYRTVDYPGAIGGTYANGINDKGVIVGSYDNGKIIGSFVYAKGKFASLRFHNSGTTAMSINNAGEIVGYYGGHNTYNGFIWKAGTFKTINPPNSTLTYAIGVNNSGDISGTYYDAAGQHGFLLHKTTYETIDVPGSNNTTNGAGLNDSGYVVGNYKDPNTASYEGFLMIGSSFQELIVPGSVTTFPAAINNSNVVIGVYFNGGVNAISFIATPQ